MLGAGADGDVIGWKLQGYTDGGVSKFKKNNRTRRIVKPFEYTWLSIFDY